MENTTSIRVELGIDARKFMQQVMIHNNQLEHQIKKGLELAIEDLSKDDNLIQFVRESAKKEIQNLAHKAIMSWEVRDNIQKSLREKVDEKIKDYTDKIAEQIAEALK